MTPATPFPGRNPSRRAVLGAGLASGLALAGCTLNNPLSDDRTPATEAVRRLSPDVAVAVLAVGHLRAADTAARLTGQRFPALATITADLRRMHAAHLATVIDAVPDRVDTSTDEAAYVVPARRPQAAHALAAAERALHDQLVGLALRAESGAFARLLGSMAAAVSQRLAAGALA